MGYFTHVSHSITLKKPQYRTGSISLIFVKYATKEKDHLIPADALSCTIEKNGVSGDCEAYSEPT